MEDEGAPPTPVPPAVEPAPAEASERLVHVDILRGFALLGILLVNISNFKSSTMPFMPASGSTLDRWVDALVSLLVEGKFYPIFVFLFGMGMALQGMRVEARGIRPKRFLARRLLALLVIGVTHAVLIWSGDILAMYALAGLVLLLFYSAQPKTLLTLAIVLWSLQLVCCGAPAGVFWALSMDAEMQKSLQPANQMLAEAFQQISESAKRAYAQGSYLDALRYRVVEWLQIVVFGYMAFLLNIASIFLLGMYVARTGLLHNLENSRQLWGKLALALVPVGLATNALYAYTVTAGGVRENLTALFAAMWLFMAFGPVLSVGYIALFALMLRSEELQKRLQWLASVGRLALTNYLLQSIVCTLIFYNYGLGLYGKVGAAAGAVLAVGIFSLQAMFSVWWTQRYRFGPAEWLWRTLTYGRRQPMRLQA
ncbi:MAG: DUF418 domain-containing protein [Chthonomonadetes bacterium]|nr:DUF418 domain-containing protein [Chthonomonadetes bacterium]